MRSVGNGSGFSFTDRSNTAFFSPDTSFRFVRYATQKSARLWSGEDLITVRWTDEAKRTATFSISNGTLECEQVRCDQITLNRMGKLTEIIATLQSQIKTLEQKLGVGPVIGQPVRPSDGGRPPFIGR